MRPDDQPRPDLDAAIDAVVPSLTAIGDDDAADSLRRTRMALAESTRGAAASTARPWRFAAAAALTIALVVVWIMYRQAPRVPEVAATPRPQAPAVTAAPAPVGPSPAPPERTATATSAPRIRPRAPERVRATSAQPSEPVPRRDPLADLVRAVQAIPEDAWARGTAPADVEVEQIAIAPLEVPAIPDAPAEPIAPGEP